MLHLAIIGLVCAVSAPNEGIASIGHKNNEFKPFCLSDEIKPNVSAVTSSRVYNVDVNDSSGCGKQKITNRTSSFFNDYITKQYENIKNSFSSDTNNITLENQSKVYVQFRKRNLLWMNNEPKSRSSIKKKKCRKRKCEEKEGQARKPKKKKCKCTPTVKACALSQREKDLFLKLKNLKISHPGHIYFLEMNDLDLEERLAKFCKKTELEKQLRGEKLLEMAAAATEENQKILKGSSKNSKHHASVIQIIKNFFTLKKNSRNHTSYNIDSNSAMYSVNNLRRKNPVIQKSGYVSIYDIPEIIQSSAIKNTISCSDACALESLRRKNLIAKPHEHSGDLGAKINLLFLINRKYSQGDQQRRFQRVTSQLYKPQRQQKNWPFLRKDVRRQSGINNLRQKRLEKFTSRKNFFYNSRGSLPNADEVMVKKNLFPSKFGEKKKFNNVNPTHICEGSCLTDHKIEKPFLKHDFRNKMENYNSKTYENSYETMTDSPLFAPAHHQRRTRQAPDFFPLPASHFLKIRHRLRHFRRPYYLHRRLLMERRKRGGKTCTAPRKCWRSAPLLCIPYIKKGQEEILRYLIQVMERMLGKPFPPKKDIFGHTKYKPSQDICGPNCYDDSCENDYVTENMGIMSCVNGTQTTPLPPQIQMKNVTFTPSMKGAPGSYKIPTTPMKVTPPMDFVTPVFNNSYFPNPSLGAPVLNEFQNPGISSNQFPNAPVLFDSIATPTPSAPKTLVSPTDKVATLKSNDSEYNNASSVSYTTTSVVTEPPTSATTREPPYVSTMSSWPMHFPHTPVKPENFYSLTPFSYNLLPEFPLNTRSPFVRESMTVPNPSEKKSHFIGQDVNLDNLRKIWPNTQKMQEWLSATTPATLPSSSDISSIMDWYKPQADDTQMQNDFLKNNPFKSDYLKGSDNSLSGFLNKKKEFLYDDSLFDENIVPDFRKNFRASKRRLRKMHQKKYLNLAPIDSIIPLDYYSYDKHLYSRPNKLYKTDFRKNLRKIKKYHLRRDKYRKLKDFDYPYSLPRRKREDDYIWPEIYSDYMDESDYLNENMKKPPEGSSRVSDKNSTDSGKNSTDLGKNSSITTTTPSDTGWSPPFFDMFSELAKVVSGLMTTESESGNITSFGSTKPVNSNTTTAMVNTNNTTPSTETRTIPGATITTASTPKTTSSTTDTTVSTSNTTPGTNKTAADITVPYTITTITTVTTTAVSDNTKTRTTNDAGAGDVSTKSSISFTDGTTTITTTPNTISATNIITTTAHTKIAVVVNADAAVTNVPTEITSKSTDAAGAATSITITKAFRSKKSEKQTTIFQDEETTRRTETTIYDVDALTMPITEQKNLSSTQNTNSSRSLGASVKAIIKKTAHKFNSSICAGKLGGSKSIDSPKLGKMSFFQTGPKANLSDVDFFTEKPSKRDSGKEDKESDVRDGQIPTTLKPAIIAKGPKKLLTKPSPKVYSKVFPDPFDSELEENGAAGINSTVATTSKPNSENKTALVSSTLKPDIRLQLLAVCEGYLDIIKRIKLLNQTFGEDLDAQLARYCENIISQNFNTQLEKPKKADLNGSPVQVSNANATEKPENNTRKQSKFSESLRTPENDKEFFESQARKKIVDDPTNHFDVENENENENDEYKELEIINDENNSTESESPEKEKPKEKKKRKKKKNSTETPVEEEIDEINEGVDEGILKRETTQEQVKLIDLLKKRKKELIAWLMNSKNQYKANEETETEYFDDEDFIPPDYDFSENSGTIKPKRDDHISETAKSLYGTNDSLYPVYAKHFGYDKEGEIREVEVLWRKINKKTHEEKILKNISVIAFLMASTNSPDESHEDVKILNGKEFEGEDVPEVELKAGNKVGFANEMGDSHEKTPSPKPENTTVEENTTKATTKNTTEKTKTTRITLPPKKNATHRFISKPDPSSIVGALPNKTKSLKNVTRKATHKYAVAKDLFQEYSIEFLNYAVYILPAMFTILFLFCCFGCALYILKSRKSFKRHKKKKRRHVSTDETSETTDSDDSSTKRKRDAKRKKKHKADKEDESLEKKSKKKFWDVLKMHSKSPYRELNEENGQNERKNFLRFLKGRKDENKTEGKTNYPDSGDEKHYNHFASGTKKETQKDDVNSEAVERRELISLLEELKKIELEQTGEKKEVKSVHVQYTIQEDDNPFHRHPEIYYPYEKNVFGLPKGYFPCSKKFPNQKTETPIVKDFEISEDASEMAALLPCECRYYSKKNDYIRPSDFGMNQEDQCKHSYKIFRDFRHKNFMDNDTENRNLGYNKYKSVDMDPSEECMGLNTTNNGTDGRIDRSPLRFSKKNPGLAEEMKHQIYKQKYVRLKDDGVLCRL